MPVFTVAVIADLQSEPVTRAQAEAVIQEAARFLHPLTSIGLVMTDFVEDGAGGSTNDMASRYINAHAGALPNGLVIFSFGDNGRAKSAGELRLCNCGPAGIQKYVCITRRRKQPDVCGGGALRS